jgi:hypothetical protein
MEHREEVCSIIHQIHPNIGDCDRDLSVKWDENMGVWEVDFRKNGQKIKHYLESEDIVACVDRKQCVGLGIEFAQF